MNCAVIRRIKNLTAARDMNSKFENISRMSTTDVQSEVIHDDEKECESPSLDKLLKLENPVNMKQVAERIVEKLRDKKNKDDDDDDDDWFRGGASVVAETSGGRLCILSLDHGEILNTSKVEMYLKILHKIADLEKREALAKNHYEQRLIFDDLGKMTKFMTQIGQKDDDGAQPKLRVPEPEKLKIRTSRFKDKRDRYRTRGQSVDKSRTSRRSSKYHGK